MEEPTTSKYLQIKQKKIAESKPEDFDYNFDTLSGSKPSPTKQYQIITATFGGDQKFLPHQIASKNESKTTNKLLSFRNTEVDPSSWMLQFPVIPNKTTLQSPQKDINDTVNKKRCSHVVLTDK